MSVDTNRARIIFGTIVISVCAGILITSWGPMAIAKRSPEAWAKHEAQLTCSPWSPETYFTTGVTFDTPPIDVGPARDVVVVPYCKRFTLDQKVSPSSPWLSAQADVYVFVTKEQFQKMDICSEPGVPCQVGLNILKYLVDEDQLPHNRDYGNGLSEGFFDYWVTTGPLPTAITSKPGSPYNLATGERYDLGLLPFTLQQDAQGTGGIQILVTVKRPR